MAAGGGVFTQMRQGYLQIPPVTRVYLSACVMTTLAVHFELISPFQLYFHPTLIYKSWQLWRLVTSFLFFGTLGWNFAFNMIFMYKYCSMLEENSFRGRTADFVLMILFGASLMIILGYFVNQLFLGQAFTIMFVYVWSRRNPSMRMNFIGVFTFHAPYLPWMLLAFSVLLGNSISVDLLGMAVGHAYYFLEDVFPHQPNGWRILLTPLWLKAIFDPVTEDPNYQPLPEDRPGGFHWGQEPAPDAADEEPAPPEERPNRPE